MENETPSSTISSSSRPANPSGSASSGIPDRQTVQVIQQALTRQPSTAAQYLQQMYAAQQQHLMLQTAALQQQQQQHLSSAQLQSLAAAQQANLAASRAPPAVSTSQQSSPQPLTIIQRPQQISSVPPTSSGIAQQAVLLGNTASPGMSANQAQMYLRAQMLIFTPTATVSNISSEVSPGTSSQVQNLAMRGAGVSQSQLPSFTTATSNLLPVTSTSQTKTTGNPQSDTSAKSTDSRGLTGRTLVPVTAHPIISTACTPHLIHPQKQIQPRPVLPAVSSSGQHLSHQCLPSPAITSLAALGPSSTCAETNGHRQSPITSLAGQEVTVQPKLLPVSSAVILQIPSAPVTNHPAAETLYKHGSTISSSLVKVQPPVPVHAAAVSITRAANPYQAHESAHTGVPGSDSCPPLDMTSGNGSSPIPAAATGNTPQNGENKPPQAVVKPQILTHVIEGFVIQEGAQPFPSHRSRAVLEVGRSSLLVGSQEKNAQVQPPEKLPQQDANAVNTTTDSEMEETFIAASKNEEDPPKRKCELCGRVDLEYKFKRSKRFCSMACAKRYNVGCTKRVGLFHPDRSERIDRIKIPKPAVVTQLPRRRSRKSIAQSPSTEDTMQVPEPITPISVAPLTTTTTTSNLKHSNSQDSSRCSDNSSYEEPLSPISASSSLSRQRHNDRGPELTDLQGGDLLTANHNFLPSDPTKWNVEDVYEFIRSLPGCQEISEEFRVQEIDGQALLLLKEDHLMSAMNIKLGPALKLYARISMLKDS